MYAFDSHSGYTNTEDTDKKAIRIWLYRGIRSVILHYRAAFVDALRLCLGRNDLTRELHELLGEGLIVCQVRATLDYSRRADVLSRLLRGSL